MPLKTYTPRRKNMLDTLRAGEVEGCWQDIDCDSHGGIAKVVVGLQDYCEIYTPGHELVQRIIAIPAMLRVLKEVRDADSIYDAKTAARDILATLGIKE